uniref:Deoxyribonuclease TATDN1 n=1 Tax=Lygus hesperus TaxID=30085 RepID=A0A0A9ZE14_LYGHE
MTESLEDRANEMSKCLDNYILVDVGANLTSRKFNRDLESVVARAKDSGVQKIVVCSQTLKGSKEALRLSQIYPGVLYSTAGGACVPTQETTMHSRTRCIRRFSYDSERVQEFTSSSCVTVIYWFVGKR